MKKYITLGNINEDNYNNFLDKINQLGEGDILDITIHSNGGKTALGEQILRIMEEHKDNIELHASFMASMAFEIFYKFSGKKYIDKNCTGMIHTHSTPNIDIAQLGVVSGDDAYWYDKIKREKPFMYPFLKKSEIKPYLNNANIWLDEKRLRKIFKQKDKS